MPVQPLHYNSAHSRGHYRLSGFTSIFVPNQSPADTCPLPEHLAADLCCDATPGGSESYGHLVPTRPLSPTHTEPPAA
jgi:hypothetical protein